MLLSVRELLVEHRTRLVNSLRGHAAEFGIVAPLGDKGVAQILSEAASDAALPGPAAEGLALLGVELGQLQERLAQIDTKLMARHKAMPISKMLAEVPGIGPISALNLATRVDFGQFKSGRHFAAWMGLTPKDHSSGGKVRLGGISRAGDERLRQLLVLGATAVIRHAKPGKASEWLLKLLARKPRKLAAVALANKMARIVWAMMTNGEAYRKTAKA
jgi:transposase